MLDLAGSEQGVSKSSRQTDSALAMESRMVNASLQHLLYAIRAKLNDQGKKERLPPHAKNAYLSKLAKLLKSTSISPSGSSIGFVSGFGIVL